MALPIVEVRVLADAQNLEGIGAPHRVIVRGVETVRDALPMLAALTKKKTLPLEGVELVMKEAAVAEEGGDDDDYCSDGEREISDTSDERSDTSDEPCDGDAEEEEEEGTGNRWILDNMQPLRNVAVLACLLEEVLYDLVPQLTHAPGDRDILRRLVTNAKEIRRVAWVLTGHPGELSLKLGNRMRKMVSHAFQDKGGEPRTEAQRAAWVAERLDSLQDQARKLYEDYTVVLE